MQGLRPLFLLRIRLAPKQTSASRLRRRNSLRASGLHHSKKNQENRLARSLSLQTFKTYKAYLSAEGSGPPMLKSVFKVFLGGQPVFMVWGDSLFSRFSFVSAPRFDAGESAIVGAEGLSPWRWHKGVFLVLVLRSVLKIRSRRIGLSAHLFSPWQSPSKLGPAHLAYRKDSVSYLFIGEVRTIRNEITYPIHGKYPLSR